MTTSAQCPVCGNPQAQGLLDDACTTRLERELADVAAIVAELDVTLSKQARIGSGDHGGKKPKGWDRERLPINVGAIEAGDNLANVLTTWARDVYREDLSWAMHGFGSANYATVLLGAIDAVRRHPAVAELVDEVTDAVAQARRAVDRPADRIYLGQCYVETPDEDGRQVTCLAEIWARPNASEVACKVCGAEHPVAERRAWLLQRASDLIVTVKEASQYLGEVGGIKVSQSSIRGYLHRQKLTYRPLGVTKGIRLGDLLAVVLDESERKGAA